MKVTDEMVDRFTVLALAAYGVVVGLCLWRWRPDHGHLLDGREYRTYPSLTQDGSPT